MTSKTETIKNRIAEVTASTRQYRRQYAPAKWQLQALEAAGLLEHMPAGLGNADADAVCKDARIGKFAKLETQGGAGDEVWTRTDAGLFFILSENDNDDDNDDPEEVARHTIGDKVRIAAFDYDQHLKGSAVIKPPEARKHQGYTEATVIGLFLDEVTGEISVEVAVPGGYDEVPVGAVVLDDVMTAAEVAAELGITERNVRKTCEDRRVKARKSGGTWLISRPDALRQWGKRN